MELLGSTLLYVKSRWSPTAWQCAHSGALELKAEMLRLLALAMKGFPRLDPGALLREVPASNAGHLSGLYFTASMQAQLLF